MPKDRRGKLSQRHQPSAKTASPIFAVSEDQTERIDREDIQEPRGSPYIANELLSAAITQPTNAPKALTHTPTKKEKNRPNMNDLFRNILTPASETNTNNAGNSPVRPKQAHGMIGEGKGVTLTKQQRKRALELERLRQPAIMTNSDYRQNPFDAIRRHAQNSLLSHENGKT
ncbi:ribosome biogenesis protein SLX9 [Rhizoctonia solani]|uniref:Ribosome biogenesis protein SLX9 n=1 Tax=Rhizoctonia solani TaxID=456999 RepID=A0A8H8SUZ0_9AGAM|nr:ribosome biogenesis protein SLX9 [Rhizoctonia solani]QRW17907.1 ribosome biogenesis protein SLX9 [Rhizoctonia solani]